MPDGPTPRYLSTEEVRAFRPAGPRFDGDDRFAPLREGLERWGQFGPGQVAGRTFPIACVALEVTQRCNLDCTLCYLSDRAEMVHDLPLAEVFRRIDLVREHYGPNTNVQITGGDPTLRSADDLRAIVAYIRKAGLRAALFTNGIKASWALLRELAAAGLNDVAFHVDMTQERKGFESEVELNAVRDAYIARAQGLGLRILFNTTVFDGNVHEVPALARFFRDRAERVRLASFQMQADTERGTLRARDGGLITQQSMIAAIERGLGIALDFDVVDVGHPRCNRYAAVLTAGDRTVPLLRDRALAGRAFAALARHNRDWNSGPETARAAARALAGDPRLAWQALRWAAGLARRLGPGLVQSRGRLNRLSFFIHNFMDATRLERDRCEGCVFMNMTANGPLSMCVHNAQRDVHVFAPAPVETPEGRRFWNPATGEIGASDAVTVPETLPAKRLKGRLREAHQETAP